MLGSSPRPLGGRIKKSMKQSPGREVVHSWGNSSWLYNHRLAEEPGQEGGGFKGSPSSSFPEPGGFPLLSQWRLQGKQFSPVLLVICCCSSRSRSTLFPEEPWLGEAEAENAQLAPRPFSHFPRSHPGGNASRIGRQRLSREALEETSFPLRAWRHVSPGGWLLTSPQSSVPSPRAPVLGQCLLLNETGAAFGPTLPTRPGEMI